MSKGLGKIQRGCLRLVRERGESSSHLVGLLPVQCVMKIFDLSRPPKDCPQHPSEEQLERWYAAHRRWYSAHQSVRRALRLLEDRGLIYATQIGVCKLYYPMPDEDDDGVTA